MEGKLIVTLSTIPSQLSIAKVILRNLQFQSKPPDQTILYLNNKLNYSNLESLDSLKDTIGLEVKKGIDYGPMTKTIFPLRDYFTIEGNPNDCIIVIDDDNILEDHTLEELYNGTVEEEGNREIMMMDKKKEGGCRMMDKKKEGCCRMMDKKKGVVRGMMDKKKGAVRGMMGVENNRYFHSEIIVDTKVISTGGIGGYRGICYPRSVFPIEKVKEMVEHFFYIYSGFYAMVTYPPLDSDTLISRFLHHYNIPIQVLHTRYPGNLQSNSLEEIINISLLNHRKGDDLFQMENSRKMIDSYFSKILPKRHIYDVFMFNGELDLLELRFLEHDSFVDRFFLVESRKTFMGKEKELTFEKNRERYSQWNQKIEYVVIDDIPNSIAGIDRHPGRNTEVERNTPSPWDREVYCRSYAKDHILSISNTNDMVLISDLDEIINPEIGTQLLNNKYQDCYSLNTDFYYYNCNWVKPTKCRAPVIVPSRSLQYYIMQNLRDSQYRFRLIDNAGWHFSYFMTPEQFCNKLKSFSHSEYNTPEYNNHQVFLDAINTGKDVFARGPTENCIRATDQHKLPKHIGILPCYLQRSPLI